MKTVGLLVAIIGVVLGQQGDVDLIDIGNGSSSSACPAVNEQYEYLARQLREAFQSNVTVHLSRSADSSQIRDQTHKQASQNVKLDLSNLKQIFEVDTQQHTVRVQAKVCFGDLVKHLLPKNYIPAVTPEFPKITVAGAIVGAALESTSFRHGQVSDNVVQCQVLLANGTLATVTQDDELFHALPGSYGSLGVVLEATLRLLPLPSSNAVVQLTATTFPTVAKGMKVLSYLATSLSPNVQFLDALQFPSGKVMLVQGTLVDSKPQSTPTLQLTSTSLWYYEQLEDMLQHNGDKFQQQFTMSVLDYLFRYNYGAFWMARPLQFSWPALLKEPILAGPFLMASAWMRQRFTGSLYTAANLYRVLHQLDATAVAERFVILDAYIPVANATSYMNFVRQHVPVTIPMWLCPVRAPSQPQPLSPSGGYVNANNSTSPSSTIKMLINVAVWGRVSDLQGIQYVSAMEEKLLELGGRKMLYSQTNMTVGDLYNQHVLGKTYFQLKKTYDPTGVFPALHDKLQLNASPKPKGFKYWMSRLLM